MTLTSLTPTSLSVPPYFGAPVPGFNPWLTDDGDDDDDDDDDDGVAELPLDVELLHAAASTATATAVTAPMARKRKCLTTLLLLKIYSAKIVRRGNTGGDPPLGADSPAHLSLPCPRWGERVAK
jgi:hypothetical protein